MQTWTRVYRLGHHLQVFDISQGDKELRRKFATPPSEKDGYQVAVCLGQREQHVLRFLTPILSPDKPNTCTVKLKKAILEAHARRRDCGWGLIMEDMLTREVA